MNYWQIDMFIYASHIHDLSLMVINRYINADYTNKAIINYIYISIKSAAVTNITYLGCPITLRSLVNRGATNRSSPADHHMTINKQPLIVLIYKLLTSIWSLIS